MEAEKTKRKRTAFSLFKNAEETKDYVLPIPTALAARVAALTVKAENMGEKLNLNQHIARYFARLVAQAEKELEAKRLEIGAVDAQG